MQARARAPPNRPREHASAESRLASGGRADSVRAIDHPTFQRWLDAYIEAWRTYDERAIADLFSEDARYRYRPWDEGDEVLEGRAAIVASWRGDQDEPGTWTAEYAPWAVDGARAVAVGVSRYFAPDGSTVEREYHNVFLCHFDDDGRCSEFTELFMLRKAGTG
jgi:hypothetical protein